MIFSPPQEPPKAPIITVWIHGTQPDGHLPPFLQNLTKSVTHMLCGDIKGLHRTAELDALHYPFLRAKTLAAANPALFQSEHLYTFGWSGNLSLNARKVAAHDLFGALKTLVTSYLEKYSSSPEIILISHSHGGNVILHLAEIEDPDGFKLSVSKAILLACPVQNHTSHLIQSPVFKRIYSLHSHTDMIQIADPQGLHHKKQRHTPLLSARHFNCHPNLAQALIRWKDFPLWLPEDHFYNNPAMKALIKGTTAINYIKRSRGLFHVEFNLPPFVRKLPAIIEQLDALFDTNANCPSHKDHDLIIEL